MSVEKLKAYEGKFDSMVKDLPVYGLPVRAILSALHMAAYRLFNGAPLLADSVSDPEAGKSAAGRLSHLVPLLLGCDAERLGESAWDVLQAYTDVDPGLKHMGTLLGYGHFCELMPEVHRGYYLVEGDEENGFVLRHPSAAFSGNEALDIVLSDLAGSLFVNPPESLTAGLFEQLAGMLTQGHPQPLIEEALGRLNRHYRLYFNEPPFLTEEGYRAAAGVGTEEFLRFRAALCAKADFAKGFASAIDRRMRQEGDLDRPNDPRWKELLEWVSVCWLERPFFDHLGRLSDLGLEKLERLVALFSIDFRKGREDSRHARDGYFPPIARLGDSVLYSPDILKLFLTARNIIFAIKHQDERLFDDMVSQHLEPALLAEAVKVLGASGSLVMTTGRSWGRKGEIDLLVYSPEENVALHVQAKAAIPPSGARMVWAIETRAGEGLAQLKRLRDLGQEERDAVLSHALGRAVQEVAVIDVLLSRSCLGTHKVWAEMGGVVPLNLTLLSGVTKRCRTHGEALSLRTFSQQVWAEINRVMQVARPQWVTRDAILGPVTFRLPMFDYDTEAVLGAGIGMWTDR